MRTAVSLIVFPLPTINHRPSTSFHRRFAITRRAMHRIFVEPRDDVLAELFGRIARRFLRLTRCENAEDDLIAADIDVLLHRLGAIVRIADDALAGLDAVFA